MSSFVHGWPNTRNIWIARVVLVVVLLALVIGLGYVHINGTYKPWMNCVYLVQNRMSADEWVCAGDLTGEGQYVPAVVKDVVNSPHTLGEIVRQTSIDFPGVVVPKGAIGKLLPWVDVTLLPKISFRPLENIWIPDKVTWPKFDGLAGVINPPLERLRGITVWTIFAFLVIVSLILTILYNIIVKPIIRLVKRDPEEWRKLLENLRTWFLILAVILLLFLVNVYRTGGLALP